MIEVRVQANRLIHTAETTTSLATFCGRIPAGPWPDWRAGKPCPRCATEARLRATTTSPATAGEQ